MVKERDLYLRLLELGHSRDLRPLLEEAIDLAVRCTGAEKGYLEIFSENGSIPRWTSMRACSTEDLGRIRAVTSRGIVAAAIASGKLIHTPSARLDERFSEQPSVRRHGIEAVLCAPVGGAQAIGVLYLQGRTNVGPFSAEDVAVVENLARHVGPIALRLLEDERTRDPTRPWRDKLSVTDIVGRSESLARVLSELSLVATHDVPVLLTGQTGTGKSQLARAIHDNGSRAAGPFVELNCGAVPEALAESELFGALAGSHSTAHESRPGRVAAANGGTLFLDEVSELASAVQVKLLQLLQSQTYYPLGAVSAVYADVRLIAATNSDLEALLAERRFREDLYYRLNVVRIRLPRLVDRREDIQLLAESFVEASSRRHRIDRLQLSPAARVALEVAEWPGNIRQLEHSLEVALIRAVGEGSPHIEERHIFPNAGQSASNELTFQEATRRFQKSLVEQALTASGWNVLETARKLDITRSYLYTLIRTYGLVRAS